MIDINRVKVLYAKGYNAVEISNVIGATVAATQKCIQRNMDYLRDKHDIAVTQRKDAIKAINYEATKYMTDRSFIQKNRSIYKTNPDGDIVINKKVAPIVTWDTPRRLVNEYR